MSDRKTLSEAKFSKDAATYDESPWYFTVRAGYRPIVAEALSQPFKSVLDIGCGTGAILSLIHEQRPSAQLFGIDLSEDMISQAKTKLVAADLKVSDSEHLPFKNLAFDLILCTFSFHHHPNAQAAVNEMRRVLAVGGRVIVADPSVPVIMRQLMNLWAPHSKDGTVRFYSRREMTELAIRAGLRVVRWTKLNWHSFMMVAERRESV